jgi:hypothetical protein
MLVEAARELNVLLIGGSIPETDKGRVYNTCIIVGAGGWPCILVCVCFGAHQEEEEGGRCSRCLVAH